ncbi:MAG: DotA/TraY family protein [Pseudomonadota bacterium]
MASFFAISSQDQSIYYLSQLFGSVGTVLVPSSGNTTFNILSVIFKSLNTTALMIGAVIVTYITITGLLKTAAEGEMLGKQWSSLWVPMRIIIGITSLFPTTAGYSLLQIIMMWIIVQGVGAADSLWTVVLNYVNAFGSPYSTVQLPTTVGVSASMTALFADLVCETTLKGQNPNTSQPYPETYSDQQGSHRFYYCADNAGSGFCTQKTLGQSIADAAGGLAGNTPNVNANALASVSGQRYCAPNGNNSIRCLFGPPTTPTSGACGSMVFGDVSKVCPGGTDITSQLQCAGYQAQQGAIAWVVDVFYNTALDLVNLDNQYLQFSTAGVNESGLPQFVGSYCSQNNIPIAACNGANRNMPPASSDDKTSASDAAVQNIYWPCYMQAIVSGQQGGVCVRGTTTGNSVDFIGTSATFYQNAINSGIATAMMGFLSTTSNLNGSTWQAAQQTGWILAGAYYYKIAAANSSNTKISIPPFAVTAPDLQGGSNNPAASYRNNLEAAATLTSQIAQQTQDPSSPTASLSGFSQVSGGMNAIAQGIWNSFQNSMTGGGHSTNPLVAMASFGESLMITAQVIFATTMAIMTAILIAVGYGADPMALGTGSPTNGALEGVKFLFQATWMILAAFMGWCFTFGGMIGIYVPLIPYIIFVTGGVGWFISVVEAMVAAPFVALGILTPGGEGLLGKADAGLMILFGTFLRPSLMIVGMIAAMIFAPVAISLVNAGFVGVMTSINSSPGLYELIVFITAYASLVVTMMSKVFSLIHLVPDRVLTWIGGPAGSAGSDAGETLGAAKSATGAAGEAASGGAQSGVGSAAGQAKESGSAANQKNNASRQERDKKKAQGGGGKGAK